MKGEKASENLSVFSEERSELSIRKPVHLSECRERGEKERSAILTEEGVKPDELFPKEEQSEADQSRSGRVASP